jgi:hypothetical protein
VSVTRCMSTPRDDQLGSIVALDGLEMRVLVAAHRHPGLMIGTTAIASENREVDLEDKMVIGLPHRPSSPAMTDRGL